MTADRQISDGLRRAGAGVRAVCGAFCALVAIVAGPHRPRTRWIVQSSRVSAGASSNARPMGAKHRLAFSWVVELAAEEEQLVEVRFTAEDSGTRVELTHSSWEKLGDAAANQRERYDPGWGTVFERHFVEYVNSAAK